MTAGSAASRRVLGITGRTSAPPDSSLPEVCSFQLPKVCSFRLPLTLALYRFSVMCFFVSQVFLIDVIRCDSYATRARIGIANRPVVQNPSYRVIRYRHAPPEWSAHALREAADR